MDCNTFLFNQMFQYVFSMFQYVSTCFNRFHDAGKKMDSNG